MSEDDRALMMLCEWISGRCETDAIGADRAERAHLLWVAHYYREKRAALLKARGESPLYAQGDGT
jgi:hypothetical protein